MKTRTKKSEFLMLVLLLCAALAHAHSLSKDYFLKPANGTFYLYNVAQGKFLQRQSNNFPGLSDAPAEVKLTAKGNGYTIMFDDGKYLKTGFWNNQYLWTDGSSTDLEAVWIFEAIAGLSNVYQLKRTDADTWNDVAGIFYVNGTNADTRPTDDCQWALISVEAYINIAKANAIPVEYRSDIPTDESNFYLYDVLNQSFFNSANRTTSEAPEAKATISPKGSAFLISGAEGKYLKIGVYKGQYLWSDGDENSTKWTIEAAAGDEAEKLYYIYTNDFSETNSEVKGKTMYLAGSNASNIKPNFARWALISENDYIAYISSGEGVADAAAVAANKQYMLEAKGEATGLLKNPTFERSSDGWWGGERGMCQLYRGNGFALEASADGSVMIQSINNMPHGVYKVVAAVRGAKGTTISARIAGNNGDAVVNRGTNSEGYQLNMNGVKMPYNLLGGFNEADNSQGWNYATAVGTLHEDGPLRVEFTTCGNGKVSVADVHLYYMSDDENVYAVEYKDGIDASKHAITCDLYTDNPNRIFTSTAAINTISGAKLNNNIVGGTVANLVLTDGYPFVSSDDFIATKATYFCRLEVGTTTAIRMPFEIAEVADGEFYEVKQRNGTTLKLHKANKAKAGQLYIFNGCNPLSALTGSGPVKGSCVGSDFLDLLDGFGVSLIKGVKLDYDSDTDSIWKKPQVTISDFAVGKECYLYNTAAGRFYTEGNSYGTQASIGEMGLKIKFISNGDAIKITNYSEAKKDWRTMFVTTNGAMYVDAETATECNWKVVPNSDKTFKLMISSPNATYNQDNYPNAQMGLDLFEDERRTVLAALLFDEEEPGEGLYLTDWAVVSTTDYDAYQHAVATYKTALQLRSLLEDATDAEIDVDDERIVYENTSSTQDELTDAIVSITNKMIEDDLKKASRDNPLDLTDKYINNPCYENNDNEGWNGTAPGIDAASNLQNAEFFNTNFDYHQDLVGLPEGVYRLSVQGFYRAGLEGPALEAKQSGKEDDYMNALLYATSNGHTGMVKMQSVFADASTAALGVNGEIKLGDWWVPNNMSSAAAYFAANHYSKNCLEIQVSDGKLRIGMKKTKTIRRDWVMFDNWKLEYIGKE